MRRFLSAATTMVGLTLATSAQANSLIPSDALPAPLAQFVERIGVPLEWIALGVLLLVLAVWRLAPRRGRRTPAPDTLAIHSLVAMAQVSLADGDLDAREITQISAILTRLTGRSYSTEQVTDLLNRLNPSPADLEQVGQDLSDKDRQIVFEAALNIAVADKQMHPSEYAIISDLAQRMRIGAEEFRKAMARVAHHLETAQPV